MLKYSQSKSAGNSLYGIFCFMLRFVSYQQNFFTYIPLDSLAANILPCLLPIRHHACSGFWDALVEMQFNNEFINIPHEINLYH